MYLSMFSRKNVCKKRQFYMTVSFGKQLMMHKQKKSFVYFNNELTEAADSSFCISKNRAFLHYVFLKNVQKN